MPPSAVTHGARHALPMGTHSCQSRGEHPWMGGWLGSPGALGTTLEGRAMGWGLAEPPSQPRDPRGGVIGTVPTFSPTSGHGTSPAWAQLPRTPTAPPAGCPQVRRSLPLRVTLSSALRVPADGMGGSGQAQPQCWGLAAAEEPGPLQSCSAGMWFLSCVRCSPVSLLRSGAFQSSLQPSPEPTPTLSRALSSPHRLRRSLGQIKATFEEVSVAAVLVLGGLHELGACTQCQMR